MPAGENTMQTLTDEEKARLRQQMLERHRTAEARRVVVRVQENLRLVRRARGISPADFARLRAQRPKLSALEEQADVQLGSLAALVASLGGVLEITARFPDKRNIRLV